ncbi:MAG TPA: sigma-70 family RNA polymerase sigma factor [Chloroflexota bacterium]
MTGRVYAQQAVAAASPDLSPSDEALMRDLAAGRHEALGPLYTRYASLVFHLAVQSLDRAVAEELVQEVFLTIWRGASSFDPSQGAFRPWLLRLTHWKILNELRHRRRQPVYTRADDQQPLHEVVDQQPGPEEQAWRAEHEDIVKSALEALPPKQRQAIAMAFLQDMTHEQVASALDVPLGTAKTRIRSGLQIMRLHLAPMAASLLGLTVAVLGFRAIQTQITLDRDQRALVMVTTSDLVPLRLTPVTASVPPGAHANYRGRAGNNLAVLTAELLPEPAAGSTYQAWARNGQRWTSLGTLLPNPDGSALLIAENPDLGTQPDSVEITLEPSGGSVAPTGTVVLAWPAG